MMKDMKKVCNGAAFSHEMKVQFDSLGGPKLVTEDRKIEAWIAQSKKEEQGSRATFMTVCRQGLLNIPCLLNMEKLVN